MKELSVELHARRESDLLALQTLAEALVASGCRPTLTVAPGVRAPSTGEAWIPGPIACDTRVSIHGSGSMPASEAESIVLVDRLGEIDVTAELRAAGLIFVGGPKQAEALRSRVSGVVVPAGIPWIDALSAGLKDQAAQSRTALQLWSDRKTVVYAASGNSQRSAVVQFGEEISDLVAEGYQVLIACDAWPSARVDQYRRLAARIPGLAAIENVEPHVLLAAADVVVSDGSPLLDEAIALGVPALRIGAANIEEINDLKRALQKILSDPAQALSAQGRERSELIQNTKPAATVIAEALLSHIGWQAEDEMSTMQSPEDEILRNIEARVAFGDQEGAIAELEAYAATRPSAEVLRSLASTQRQAGRVDDAKHSIRRAESLAREQLGRVLCESARVQLEGDRIDNALSSFTEAHRLAPELADASLGLGTLSLHAGDPATAKTYFRGALEFDKSAKAWSGLGLSLAAEGQSRDALSAFESALDLENDCQAAIYGLVQAAFQTGELRIAESRVREFTELHSANLDMLFTLAGLRHQLGDREGATEVAERIALFNADYPGLQELRQKLGA